jgi:hypothetical protein
VTKDALEQDLLALAATLEPAEADALKEMFALATELEFETDEEEEYTPFVYPH